MSDINNVFLSEHFNLREFENDRGEVKIHPRLVSCLEALRTEIKNMKGAEHMVIITSGYRSEEENIELAERLGWTDEGGLVAKDSQHRFGRAADIVAVSLVNMKALDPTYLGDIARKFFDYVNVYETHVHVDVRHSA